jgi:hypothetical protein
MMMRTVCTWCALVDVFFDGVYVRVCDSVLHYQNIRRTAAA